VSGLAVRLAVVTGASRGIGAAVGAALAAGGARVLGISRSGTASAQGVQPRRCDVTDADAVAALAGTVSAHHGTPDVVVSNAGGFLLRPLAETTPAEFDAQVAVNLRGAFLMAKAFLPAMRSAGRGSYISVGSVADHIGFPENAAYSAAKYGLRGLHEALAAEYRGSGVRLTLVSPGPTDTAIWDPFDPDQRPGFPARQAMLRPEDVADAIVFAATRPPRVHIDWIRLGPA
jgi:NAD(P)-dependent dehydrogenase (short-subunit alcohol dehydrogenase family)